MGLVLARTVGQTFVIDGDIVVTVIEVKGRVVRLDIQAPKDVEVWRGELLDENGERKTP